MVGGVNQTKQQSSGLGDLVEELDADTGPNCKSSHCSMFAKCYYTQAKLCLEIGGMSEGTKHRPQVIVLTILKQPKPLKWYYDESFILGVS